MQNSSFDFKLINDKYNILINFKTQKEGSNNNAVAAINKLYYDYDYNLKQQKDFYFMVVKVGYKFSKNKIYLVSNNNYCLEEISFDNGHKQDHRNWSEKGYKKESGRLEVSEKFYLKNKLLETENISN